MTDLTEKVPCVEGKPVAVKLAASRNGRCLRCYLKRNPFFVLYNSLIESVWGSPTGFDFLSDSEKLYCALTLFQTEVNNGGFHQFFFHSSGGYYALIERGLAALNESDSLELLRQAKEIVFLDAPLPVDIETRRTLMPYVDPNAPRPQWAEKLDGLDGRFYANPDTLPPKLMVFARKHGLVGGENNEEVT
jgi:Domain of unknown function (DUF4375)